MNPSQKSPMKNAKPNGELKIEKNVPVPERARDGGNFATLRKMEAGDSVFFPDATNKSVMQSAAQVFGPGNYITRKTDGGRRVWRIK